MTRKKAIEIVVANVKMGWPPKRWNEALIGISGTTLKINRMAYFYVTDAPFPMPRHCVLGWYIPRKWLEERNYL